ncbi:uncharacterized protein LOC130992636 [Salvia miltiorrhiza]|uniref:uncharacterized protein LOC130992636 n=1 Tax=Salvia miltiorrhiza TaxID=226208 RepID=UPI0025AB9FF8|nr:uncharacterized protein LOC130992636 [Salvia miltiorrhiza]XP_057773340.1 uncharacterized protein LOC130992636 [Salvia miltiorrhiza]XP_057773341.1 uncharacterized protein LOC130992636 [Salvia miltiorrhiza]
MSYLTPSSCVDVHNKTLFSCVEFTPFIVSGCASAFCSLWSDLIHIPILPATEQSDEDASCPSPISGKELMVSMRKNNPSPQKGKRKAEGNTSEHKRKKKSKMAQDLSVITHMHLERLRKLRKNDEDIDIFNASEFHRYIDQLVEQFQNMKRSSKQSVCKKVKGEESGEGERWS